MLIDLAENQGVTIFISSRILGEISKFCTKIGIIHNGKLVQEFNANKLNSLCEKNLLIQTKDLKSAHSIIIENGFANCKINDNTINCF